MKFKVMSQNFDLKDKKIIIFSKAIQLEIDESSFTGEIEPARKCTLTLSTNNEKSNMALMGTLVRAGKGKVT